MTIDTIRGLADQLADQLDRLEPDRLTGEECVALVEILTKGPNAVVTVAKSTVELLHLRLADLVPPKTAASIGGRTVRSKPGAPSYKNWDSERLLMDVLDSRRFDPGTGELVEETPGDKLAHVYGLSGSSARKTALKERGIDPKDYCEVEYAPKVEVI